MRRKVRIEVRQAAHNGTAMANFDIHYSLKKHFWLSELAVTGKKIQLGKCNRTRHTRCLRKFITFYHFNTELVWSHD